MRQRSKVVTAVAAGVAGAAVLLSAAFIAGRATGYRTVPESMAPQYSTDAASGVAGMAPGAAPYAGTSGAPAQRDLSPEASTAEEKPGGAADKLIIRNAEMAVRVDDTEQAIEQVRSLAARYKAEIVDLYVDSPAPDTRPLAEAAPGPASAQVTVRVPAEDLDELTAQIEDLGTVLSQRASAADVTEEHVDLEARLKNLRAEESRLREFFDRASSVKDLLAVQGELSRVRGEIEAMTAQITYLERQAARATLTISLSEPGPIVRPDGQDWGFRDALTDGVRGAVALMTTTLTVLVAVSPLLLLGLVAWVVVRRVRARRASGASHAPGDAEAASEVGRP